MLNAKDIGLGVVGFGKDVLNTKYSVGNLLFAAAADVAVGVGVRLIYELEVDEKIKNKIKNRKRKSERECTNDVVVIDVEV